MERDQLLLAAKERDIATIEMLIHAKYVDVNSRTPLVLVGDDIFQVTIYVY